MGVGLGPGSPQASRITSRAGRKKLHVHLSTPLVGRVGDTASGSLFPITPSLALPARAPWEPSLQALGGNS
jgi:hypothetical protein